MPYTKETTDTDILRRLLKGATRTDSGCLERPHAGQQKTHMRNRWYTQICVHKDGRPQTRLAHREAYRLQVGPLLEGLVVMHACDNPRCIEPSHLSLGTQTLNMADMWAKRRIRKSANQSPSLPL